MKLIKKLFIRSFIVKRIRKYAIKVDFINIRLAFEKEYGYHLDSLISTLKQEQYNREKAMYERAIKRLFKIYLKHI